VSPDAPTKAPSARGRTARPPLAYLAVVVPAHDEEDLITSCVESVLAAAAHPGLAGVAIELVVVADACRDRTAARAAAAGAHVLVVTRRNVGAARDAGMHWALDRASDLEPEAVWLASTDADTTVPRHWLAAQRDWHRRGADAVAGTVTVDDWTEHPPTTARRFAEHQRRIGLGPGHGHVHGANLGLTGAAYHAVGGMPGRAQAEDEELWRRLAASGRRRVQAAGLEVVTSARRAARAPGGFSELLKRLGD
jgi:hypothetical protein